MATRRQKAAARRNLRKARAAKRRIHAHRVRGARKAARTRKRR